MPFRQAWFKAARIILMSRMRIRGVSYLSARHFRKRPTPPGVMQVSDLVRRPAQRRQKFGHGHAMAHGSAVCFMCTFVRQPLVQDIIHGRGAQVFFPASLGDGVRYDFRAWASTRLPARPNFAARSNSRATAMASVRSAHLVEHNFQRPSGARSELICPIWSLPVGFRESLPAKQLVVPT
jgi:hypothetical protein